MSINHRLIERRNKLQNEIIENPKHPIIKAILLSVATCLLFELNAIVGVIFWVLSSAHYVNKVIMPLAKKLELKLLNSLNLNVSITERIKEKITKLGKKIKSKKSKKVIKAIVLTILSVLFIEVLPAFGITFAALSGIYLTKDIIAEKIDNYKVKKESKNKNNLKEKISLAKNDTKEKVESMKKGVDSKIKNLKINTKDKFNNVFKVKRDFNGKKIVNGTYGLKKNKIIQDYVNIKEINKYYEKEKTLVKNF